MKKAIDENKLLLQFMLFSVLGGAGMGIAQMVITLYAVSLAATASQIGLIGGVQGIGLLLTVLPIGVLVDRATTGGVVHCVRGDAPPVHRAEVIDFSDELSVVVETLHALSFVRLM